MGNLFSKEVTITDLDRKIFVKKFKKKKNVCKGDFG
jgi:hypothetical protein